MGRAARRAGCWLGILTGVISVGRSSALEVDRERAGLQAAEAFVQLQRKRGDAGLLSTLIPGAQMPEGSAWRVLAYRPALEARPEESGLALPELERSARGVLSDACVRVVDVHEWEVASCQGGGIATRYRWKEGPFQGAPEKAFVQGRERVEASQTFRSRAVALDQFALEPFPMHVARRMTGEEVRAWVGERGLVLPLLLERELQRRGVSWRLPPEGVWWEASDFFGRRTVALWVPQEPWPRYLRSPAGLTIFDPSFMGAVERPSLLERRKSS